MYNWTEIKSIDTHLFSDSTEISPNKKNCVNCCYQLNESTKIREGSISLINIDDNVGKIVSKKSLIDGILDCCWINDSTILLAGANGNLYNYNYDNSSVLNCSKTIEIGKESLCLSVDFFGDKILTSTSKGNVALLDLDYRILFDRKVHEYEAWVCHLSRHNTNLYFTGGDDCQFKAFDLRINNDVQRNTKLFTRSFEMGVTSLNSAPTNANIISIGGYDEQLRLVDLRNITVDLATIDIGGGVWRHKWCPEGNERVLVAAMYAGFVVVDIKNSTVGKQPHHSDCLGYGADWVRRDDGDYMVALSSFYDHRWTLSRLSTL